VVENTSRENVKKVPNVAKKMEKRKEKSRIQKQENANPPPQVAHTCPQSRRLREVALWTAMDNLPRPTGGKDERVRACVVSDDGEN
jgi:hypothetical protein